MTRTAEEDLFHSNPVPMIATDREHRITRVNRSYLNLTGYSEHEVIGRNPSFNDSRFTSHSVQMEMFDSIKENGSWHGKVWNKDKVGDTYPVMLFIMQATDGYMASFHRLSIQDDALNRLLRLVNYDHLTGLVNRTSINNQLDRLISIAQSEGEPFAVLYLDMNRFKNINDLLGHAAGDELLIEVGARLQNLVRDDDMAGRIGGDEFVVLLSNTNPLIARHIAERINKSLSSPYLVAGKEVRSTPSIGVSAFPTDGSTVDELLHNADMAMYQAKSAECSDEGCIQFFSKEMNKDILFKLEVETDLRQAIKNGELSMYYQPLLDSNTMKVVKVEALMRWDHPTKGNIPPDVFIPVAEESGLITQLGGLVIEETISEMAKWRENGLYDVPVAINISSIQLRQLDLPTVIGETLDRYGLSGVDIEVEITESVAITNPEQSIAMIKRFHDIGIKVAMDDFGTGYSSLSYLKNLPFDTIKLDKSFVHNADIENHDAAISMATISLAHNIKLKIVAEGVETKSQQDFLKRNYCDLMQGFLFCRPLPGNEAMQFVLQHNSSKG